MPRIADETANSAEYWTRMYATGEYPTGDYNNGHKYRSLSASVVGDSVLDVGCGQCGLAACLPLDLVRYTGIDYGKPAPVPQVDGPLTIIHADAMAIDWPAADTVVMADFVEHFSDPAPAIAKAAAAATRRIVVCVPISGLFTPQQHRGEHFWDFSHDEMRALLEGIGEVSGPIRANCLCEYWTVDKP